MEDVIRFEAPKNQSSIIKVIGVGGGGSNAVNHMYKQGIKDVDFVVCNTDLQALDMSPVPNKIHLGKKGLGAGSIPLVGEKAAEEKTDEIRELLKHNTNMLFITAGMGGGTGTGAAPVIAKIAKEVDLEDEDVPKILTVAIITIPFSFEGKKRKDQASKGIKELRKYCDAVLIISNDKLRELYGDLPLSRAFAQADNVLLTAARGIAEIITDKAYVNIDFKDVNTVMSNSGVAIMGTGMADGEERARKAIEMALTSPLLNDNDISGTNNILLYLSSGKKEISMDEITDITELIISKAGSEVEIIWGAGKDESLDEQLCVTVVATGFDKNELQSEKIKVINDLYGNEIQVVKGEKNLGSRPKKIELINKESFSKESDSTLPPIDLPDEKIYFSLEDNEKDIVEKKNIIATQKESSGSLFEEDNINDLGKRIKYRQVKVTEETDDMTIKSKERISKLKSMSMQIKNPNGLVELENEPAYKRKKIKLSNTTPSEESIVSRFSLEEGEDNNIKLKSDNSFLHDNVD